MHEQQHVQDVRDQLKRELVATPGTVHVDLAYISGHNAVCVVVDCLVYRFGPLDGLWGAEYRNRLVDPPGQYDNIGDGPADGAPVAEIVAWIIDELSL